MRWRDGWTGNYEFHRLGETFICESSYVCVRCHQWRRTKGLERYMWLRKCKIGPAKKFLDRSCLMRLVPLASLPFYCDGGGSNRGRIEIMDYNTCLETQRGDWAQRASGDV